jgi:hypothetical protein
LKSDDVNLICKIFSNIEELHCPLKELDGLLLILKHCSKISIINLSDISADIYSWIQVNASKLNVYIDFMLIDGKLEDVFIRSNNN